MNLYLLITSVLVSALLTYCSDVVSLTYSTRTEAESEPLFARGWLPEMIPASSKAITMRNDLDQNISTGEFLFDPLDYDKFINQLERIGSEDKVGFSAYCYQDWTFWVSDQKNLCRFYMATSRKKRK